MAIIVLTSAAGAPGTTCTGLGLALTWPRRVLLVEADPAGSSLIPGWLAGRVDGRRDLFAACSAVLEGEQPADAVVANAVPVAAGMMDTLVLLGWRSPSQAAGVTRAWDSLAQAFADLDEAGMDVIIDTGRATQGSWPAGLLAWADQTLLVTRAHHADAVRSVPVARAVRDTLAASGREDTFGLVVVGADEDRPAGIARQLGYRLAAAIAWDPKWARVLAHGWPDPGNVTERHVTGLHRSGLRRSYQAAARGLAKAGASHRRRLEGNPQ